MLYQFFAIAALESQNGGFVFSLISNIPGRSGDLPRRRIILSPVKFFQHLSVAVEVVDKRVACIDGDDEHHDIDDLREVIG